MHLVRGLVSTRRRIAVVAATAVVVVAAAWWFTRSDATASPTTVTAEVTSSTVSSTVTGSGTLEAEQSKDLSFSSSGTVTAVKVDEGDTVKKGQTLATIDTTSLEADLASAQAQLDSAETTAADDSSESAAQQAANTASVASAEADVTAAEDALDDATLTAPFAGLVSSVGLAVGDQTGSSSSSGASGAGGSTGDTGTSTTTTSTGSITVITPKKFVVTAEVSADDVEKLKTAMQAEVTPAGATDPVYGTVTEVGKVATVGTSGTATFPVTVTLTGEEDNLYAGTTADVSIIIEKRDNVLSVPTQAVTTSGDTTYVDVVKDGKTTKTAVTIGDAFGPTTEITKGLSEGDTISYTQAARTRAGGGTGGTQQGGFPGSGEMPSGGFPGGGQGGFPGGDQ